MRTQSSVESLCRHLYQQLGKDPAEITQIKPIDGGWNNALSYEVTRRDMKRARVYRRDLDDDNTENIRSCLGGFPQAEP